MPLATAHSSRARHHIWARPDERPQRARRTGAQPRALTEIKSHRRESIRSASPHKGESTARDFSVGISRSGSSPPAPIGLPSISKTSIDRDPLSVATASLEMPVLVKSRYRRFGNAASGPRSSVLIVQCTTISVSSERARPSSANAPRAKGVSKTSSSRKAGRAAMAARSSAPSSPRPNRTKRHRLQLAQIGNKSEASRR